MRARDKINLDCVYLTYERWMWERPIYIYIYCWFVSLTCLRTYNVLHIFVCCTVWFYFCVAECIQISSVMCLCVNWKNLCALQKKIRSYFNSILNHVHSMLVNLSLDFFLFSTASKIYFIQTSVRIYFYIEMRTQTQRCAFLCGMEILYFQSTAECLIYLLCL